MMTNVFISTQQHLQEQFPERRKTLINLEQTFHLWTVDLAMPCYVIHPLDPPAVTHDVQLLCLALQSLSGAYLEATK